MKRVDILYGAMIWWFSPFVVVGLCAGGSAILPHDVFIDVGEVVMVVVFVLAFWAFCRGLELFFEGPRAPRSPRATSTPRRAAVPADHPVFSHRWDDLTAQQQVAWLEHYSHR